MEITKDCKIGIVGLGLMGGAIAMALKNNDIVQAENLYALDVNQDTLRDVKAAGVIGQSFTDPNKMLPLCDIVFLCLNPSTLLNFMQNHMAAFKSNALITDIAGTKQNIVSVMEKTLRPDLDFIPGHPMAGSEKGGFENARFCNFSGKNYILTPLERNKKENIDFIKELIHCMGFGRVTITSAEEHDRKIAFTSQLCHVIAAALVDCESDTEITRFGGGSFEDLTRIAMLNAPMWTELFIENRGDLLPRIEQFEESLDKIRKLITCGNDKALKETLAVIRDRRIAMSV